MVRASARHAGGHRFEPCTAHFTNPMDLSKIQAAAKNRRHLLTEHAEDELVEDNLRLEDVVKSLMEGEIIEDYPDDFPFPSCLVYGKNERGEPIHSVWAFDDKKNLAILITTYRPDPQKWVDYKKRR